MLGGLDSIKEWRTVNAMKVDEHDVKDGVETIVHLLHQTRMENGQRVPVAREDDQKPAPISYLSSSFIVEKIF